MARYPPRSGSIMVTSTVTAAGAASGEAMDLSDGLPYTASMDIYAGTYDDVADCALAIITAGENLPELHPAPGG